MGAMHAGGNSWRNDFSSMSLRSFYHANYLHNVAMGWPTAEENTARADAGLGCVHCAAIRARATIRA